MTKLYSIEKLYKMNDFNFFLWIQWMIVKAKITVRMVELAWTALEAMSATVQQVMKADHAKWVRDAASRRILFAMFIKFIDVHDIVIL